MIIQGDQPTVYELHMRNAERPALMRRAALSSRACMPLAFRCADSRKPDAYRCQCSFIRLLHWADHPCPRCGSTREQSVALLLAKAEEEDARKRKAMHELYGGLR